MSVDIDEIHAAVNELSANTHRLVADRMSPDAAAAFGSAAGANIIALAALELQQEQNKWLQEIDSSLQMIAERLQR